MKKLSALVILGALLFVVGCSKEKKHHEKEHVEEMAQAYYCPMECEGDTTYADKDAKCPVCKMDLVEKKKEGEHVQHESHDESVEGEEHKDVDNDGSHEEHKEEGH